MRVRLAGINRESVTDGPGVRAVVYLQGCRHGCAGCHNPKTHPLDGGYLADTDEILEELLSNSLVSGLTISGGEPLLQPDATLALAKRARAYKHDVWLYTGYSLEELVDDPQMRAILREVDVLVDGRFKLEERDLSLPYRGSRNQRILYADDLEPFVRETDSPVIRI